MPARSRVPPVAPHHSSARRKWRMACSKQVGCSQRTGASCARSRAPQRGVIARHQMWQPMLQLGCDRPTEEAQLNVRLSRQVRRRLPETDQPKSTKSLQPGGFRSLIWLPYVAHPWALVRMLACRRRRHAHLQQSGALKAVHDTHVQGTEVTPTCIDSDAEEGKHKMHATHHPSAHFPARARGGGDRVGRVGG